MMSSSGGLMTRTRGLISHSSFCLTRSVLAGQESGDSLSHGGLFHHRVFSSRALGLAPLEAISAGLCAVGT